MGEYHGCTVHSYTQRNWEYYLQILPLFAKGLLRFLSIVQRDTVLEVGHNAGRPLQVVQPVFNQIESRGRLIIRNLSGIR